MVNVRIRAVTMISRVRGEILAANNQTVVATDAI
jgi:hypothetical protein